jgi:hypothetical protein
VSAIGPYTASPRCQASGNIDVSSLIGRSADRSLRTAALPSMAFSKVESSVTFYVRRRVQQTKRMSERERAVNRHQIFASTERQNARCVQRALPLTRQARQINVSRVILSAAPMQIVDNCYATTLKKLRPTVLSNKWRPIIHCNSQTRQDTMGNTPATIRRAKTPVVWRRFWRVIEPRR